MPNGRIVAFAGAAQCLATLLGCAGPQPQPDDRVAVSIETEEGVIVLAVDTANAPLTAFNFLRYVDAGLYDGGSFYRTVRSDNQPNDSIRIEVVQGGMNRERTEESFPPIRLEGTEETGLRHLDGTVSMARAGPNTATAEIFICIGNQPALDEGGMRNPDGLGFAAFGQVVEGMDVVRAIQRRAAQGQSLDPAVRILSARRTQ